MSRRVFVWFLLVVGVVFLFIGNFKFDRKSEIVALQKKDLEDMNVPETSQEISRLLKLEAVRRVQLGDFISAAAICRRSAFLDPESGNCQEYLLKRVDKKMAGLKSAVISLEASGFPGEASLMARSAERIERMEVPE
ncbi:MAG TPA: hypothetical protein PKU96_00905 [bacterium]|nr:hypothetical protein [Myxococcales bacterium]OQA59831.1 MAG: hypothetical protein BWY40_01090 [bacterium ADurb.Bin270]HPW44913.1 hypothetical protein [bacterium]HQC50480.1 hypothetical protein [bacterium]HQH80966.1 hypothetical protein [bacterium]